MSAETDKADFDQYLSTKYANTLIFGASALSLAYAGYCYYVIRQLKMTAECVKVQTISAKEKQ